MTEFELTCEIHKYLELLDIPHTHTPNEAKRDPKTGYFLKQMGMSAGFPDLTIPVPNSQYHGLFIELKKDRTSKPSKEQKRWINLLNENGYRAVITYGLDETIEEINQYFKGKGK